MPTPLPIRRPDEPDYPKLDAESRALFVAAILLLATLALACNKYFPPFAGYSPAPAVTDLQLSP